MPEESALMHRRWNVIAGRASMAGNPASAAVELFEALHPAGQKATHLLEQIKSSIGLIQTGIT